MTTPAYDYSGMLASTWDLWRDNTANWPDRKLYLEIIQQYGQPVLDMGCATGRLVLEYCALGIDTDGVDNSPEMIAICRSKAEKMGVSPNLYQQDMTALDLPRTYRTILCSSSSLQLVTDADEVGETMRRFFKHLQPGGVLIASFGFEWREGDPLETDWEPVFFKTRPEDGAMVRSWVHVWHEPEKQWWHSEQRFEVELNGEIITKEEHRQSPDGRWYSQAQAAQVFQDAGFKDIQLFHGFENAPAEPDDRLFCVLGVKP